MFALMILTIIGGGGFRVPLVYRALLNDASFKTIDTVRLFDTDPERLATIAGVLAEMADQALGKSATPKARLSVPKVELHTNLATALTGTDFIFCAIRVGGLAGRQLDETIPAAHNLIGQETVGAGGIAYGLRTIPVMAKIAQLASQLAPDAWFINFTNPAGMVTQAITPILGDKVVGICDSPIGLARRALRALNITCPPCLAPDSGIEIDYVGLNHLGWLTGLKVAGQQMLPKLLSDSQLLESFEEGQLFGAELINQLKAIPNEYLHYYYFARENLAANLGRSTTRAGEIMAQQRSFYTTCSSTAAFDRWEKCRLAREETYMASNRAATSDNFARAAEDLTGGGYEQVALAIMKALANDDPSIIIVNRPNGQRISWLAENDVIEASCLVDGRGIHPLPVSDLPLNFAGLVSQIKHVEKCTIAASLAPDYQMAWQAMANHPLIDSVKVAREVLDDFIRTDPNLTYLST